MHCERLPTESKLNSSNMGGSFIMADLNLFLSPYEILPIAPDNKSLRTFSYFIMKFDDVCTHYNRMFGAILMSALNISLLYRRSKRLT